MSKVALTILLLFQIFSSFAGNKKRLPGDSTSVVSGIVVNAYNKPLPFATVKLWIDSLEKQAVICDSNGYFTINIGQDIKEKLFLEAFYLKAKSGKHTVNNEFTNIILTVSDSTNLLSAITIIAQKPLLERKADRFVFTPKKELTKGATALDLMRHAPVLQFDNRSESFSIIGKPGTVVYLNNRKSEVPNDMLLQMLRSLPASDIKSIEIITNPGSEYGANIAGGIINIILKKELYEGWMGNFSIQTLQSAYNTTMVNGAVSYRRKNFAVQIMPFINRSYNYYTSDNLLSYLDNTRERQQKDHFRRYTVYGGGLNADYEINKQNMISLKSWNSVVFGKSDDHILTDITNTPSSNADETILSEVKGKDFYSYNFGNLNYHWTSTAKSNLYLDLNIDYNHFTQNRDNEGRFQFMKSSGGSVPDPVFYKNDLPQQFDNLSAKAESGVTVYRNWQLKYGGQLSRTRVENKLKYYDVNNNTVALDSNISNHFIYAERYWSVFANLSGKITDKLQAALGLRMEKTNYAPEIVNKSVLIDSNYLKFYPSFGIAYAPVEKYQLGYSFSRKIVRPNIETLFPGRTYNTPNYFIENNPFLQPSIISSHELSLLMNNKYSFVLGYSAARNSFSQFVIPVMDNNSSQMKQTYLNYGTQKSLSLMFNGNWSLFKNFWEIYFTPVLSYNTYQGTVANGNVSSSNVSANVVYDNYLYFSRKKGWTGFVTFKYNTPVRDVNGRILNTMTSLDLEVKKTYKQLSFYLIASDIYNGSSLIKSNQYANPVLVGNRLEVNNYTRSLVFKIRFNFGNGQVKTIKDRHTANEEIRNRAN